MARKGYGPRQLRDHLGLADWQMHRARADGSVPAPDLPDGRWSVAVAERLLAGRDELVAGLGALPDMGATRAAAAIGDRLGRPVSPDAVSELARAGVLPVVGEYKGYPLVCGRAVERFTDVAALDAAAVDGRLYLGEEVPAVLGVRASDVGRLVQRGWLVPVQWASNSHVSRRYGEGTVALYRHGDLMNLLACPDIDWVAARAVPKGRPSLFAALPERTVAA